MPTFEPAPVSLRPSQLGPLALAPGRKGKGLPLRVALIADFQEEGWPSMDLVADQLQRHLPPAGTEVFEDRELRVETLRPAMWLLRRAGESRPPAPLPRVLNRFLRYPRFLKSQRQRYDLFHIVDHSYAHLVHALPAERTVVTCHDLDTFRCVLEPAQPPRRGKVFRLMTARILAGLQRAAHVCCVSEATRADVLAHGWLPAERLSVTPNGVQPELLNPACAVEGERLLDQAITAAVAKARPASRTDVSRGFDLLHVGSNIARKRLETLLAVLARVRQTRPGARL
ncbi:MAG: glycosyltransferase, partial [Verrucomicrobia bacterium]|nr:glycosyltransferase [Verrucomicrobiota bacterium]